MIDVTTWSLYIEPDAVPWWPMACTVVEVSPLLRELLHAANELDVNYDQAGRGGLLLRLALSEMQRVSPLPFSISLPPTGPLRTLCRSYLAAPDVEITNADWARASAMSPRTLDRHFREATGSSPAAWRARARLPMLRSATISAVSGRLGYSSPSAFTAAFTKAFGTPPSTFTSSLYRPRAPSHTRASSIGI